ncbi:hypothetical protein ABBQ38_004926 [Trebouxia sp. C0009 RCD-2024]
MSNAVFWGCLLLSAGPPTVLYCLVIGRKSFLVLLSLASAFFWLVIFLVIAVICRAVLPLGSAASYVLVSLLSVSIQEAARYGLWTVHRRCVAALEMIAQKKADTHLTVQNQQAMALTHGFAHGVVQSVLFNISWLPLSLGDATYYVPACASMSYFLVSALLLLGFFLLHTASMVVSFEGLAAGHALYIATPPALHLVTSLLTVANLAKGGCVVVVPLVLCLGLAMTVVATWMSRQSASNGYQSVQDLQLPDDI